MCTLLQKCSSVDALWVGVLFMEPTSLGTLDTPALGAEEARTHGFVDALPSSLRVARWALKLLMVTADGRARCGEVLGHSARGFICVG